MSDSVPIPARSGVAQRLARGDTVTVVNTHGNQVVDTWAFAAGDGCEHLSMEHSRTRLLKLTLAVGDTLVSNRRRPMLTVAEDTTGGAHDMLIAACDAARYRELGVDGHHDSCADNLAKALDELGLVSSVPSPLNLFMNVPIAADGKLAFAEPTCRPGDRVTLRAEQDLVIVFSACPQDMTSVNGHQPTEAHFSVRRHEGRS